MKLSLQKLSPGSRRTPKRVGRGIGSGKGKSAGRGTKGQRARSGGKSGTHRRNFGTFSKDAFKARRWVPRSGGKSGTHRRALKASLLKVPKLRGFQSKRAQPESVTLTTLNKLFEAGEKVTPATLENRGAIHSSKNRVKILATGEITKKLTIEGCLFSKKASEMIEKVGGKIVF